MENRKKIVFVIMLCIFFGSFNLYYYVNELGNFTPVELPSGATKVKVHEKIDLRGFLQAQKKPVLIHFFNPACECSDFNFEHFEWLIKKYSDKTAFYVALQTTSDIPKQAAIDIFYNEYGDLGIPILIDEEGVFAQSCGVYSTPQAILLDAGGGLFYKGNYNKSRFCTSNNTAYVKTALDSIVSGGLPPPFAYEERALYGCALPALSPSKKNVFFSFEQ